MDPHLGFIERCIVETVIQTRMHSSRMLTARSSSRLLGWGVCLNACIPSGTGPGHPPGPWSGHPTLWTEFLTHASENIALPQLRAGGNNMNGPRCLALKLLRTNEDKSTSS